MGRRRPRRRSARRPRRRGRRTGRRRGSVRAGLPEIESPLWTTVRTRPAGAPNRNRVVGGERRGQCGAGDSGHELRRRCGDPARGVAADGGDRGVRTLPGAVVAGAGDQPLGHAHGLDGASPGAQTAHSGAHVTAGAASRPRPGRPRRGGPTRAGLDGGLPRLDRRGSIRCVPWLLMTVLAGVPARLGRARAAGTRHRAGCGPIPAATAAAPRRRRLGALGVDLVAARRAGRPSHQPRSGGAAHRAPASRTVRHRLLPVGRGGLVDRVGGAAAHDADVRGRCSPVRRSSHPCAAWSRPAVIVSRGATRSGRPGSISDAPPSSVGCWSVAGHRSR
jgi:hypothetical protein